MAPGHADEAAARGGGVQLGRHADRHLLVALGVHEQEALAQRCCGRDLVVLAGAGVAGRTLLFTLSGSVNAVQTAWRGILEPKLSPHEGLAATNRAFTSRS